MNGQRVVIVTGASSGIGRDLARAAARAGYAVVGVARRKERLDALAAEIAGRGGNCVIVVADVTASDSPTRIVSQALASFGRIDILVHNAGAAIAGPLLAQTQAQIDSRWQLHVSGPLRITREAWPALEESHGQVIFVGSGVAQIPLPLYGAYCAAKAALRAVATQLRRESHASGVAVTYIDPGTVETEFSLEDVSLRVCEGEAIGIVGENGSGKSTLLKAIAGLLTPTRGSVSVFGKKPKDLAPGSVAYVPQVEAVDWTFPVTSWDVVAMGRFPRLGLFRSFGAGDRDAVVRALDLVRMAKFADRHISALSGGQQQRIFVARAIAQEPKVLLLDEPTTGVDAETEEALRGVIRGLVERGLPILMATHALDEASEWFDRLVVLNRRVLEVGPTDEVLQSGVYSAIHHHEHTHGQDRRGLTRIP